ncbi:hypothetical protein N658DRAFT_501925 [Parathielavia hyrcaniae]|uniref:Uncharacterized protein n=1 Tax=Parathielavia hyrcaniae TaxID=113614 RepID=A0AAN6SX63_9PEZI|nr:hypothetical protein N658DRAFT_501925 [Parathielavia hyrcaniae]
MTMRSRKARTRKMRKSMKTTKARKPTKPTGISRAYKQGGTTATAVNRKHSRPGRAA